MSKKTFDQQIIEGLLGAFFDRESKWRFARVLLLASAFGFGFLVSWAAARPILSGWQFFWLSLPAVTAFAGALFHTVRFSQDIFDLPSFWHLFRHWISLIFPLPYAKAIIDSGEILDLKEHERKILDEIGGPLSVYIRPGNLIVVQYPWEPEEIFDIGWHLMRRFGKIKAIIDLREQECLCPEFGTATKDGINVTVKEAFFRYRIYRDPGESQRTRVRPYPYSNDAVKKAAGSSNPQKWQDAVSVQFQDVIKDFIASHRFDYLTNFTEENTRTKLHQHIQSEAQKKLLEKGAELIFFDPGSFDYDESIKKQYFENWQSEWTGYEMVERAYGEARKVAYEELGRAEGQAEMLMSIVHALDAVDISDNPQQRRKNVRSLVLIRTAQVLESLALKNEPNDTKKGKKPSTNQQPGHEERSGIND